MVVNIKLEGEYRISSDRVQWILLDANRCIGYFEDLESLVKCYFKQKLRMSSAKTISGLIEVHKRSLRVLSSSLQPLNISVKGINAEVRPNEIKEVGI